MEIKWIYFQYRRTHQFPVYLRFKSEDLQEKFKHVLNEMGFNLLTSEEAKKISLEKTSTKILTIQSAIPRIQKQIVGSDLLDKSGPEILSLQIGIPIYTYRKVGMMAMPQDRLWWELALSNDIQQTDQMVGLRVILVRYLAHALADFGVLTYWGAFKDDHVVVMKQVNSFGEAVMIDVTKKLIFSNGGEAKLNPGLKIIRKDKEVSSARSMSREDLISFLNVSTCLLQFTGMSQQMRTNAMELSKFSSASYGVVDFQVSI